MNIQSLIAMTTMESLKNSYKKQQQKQMNTSGTLHK